MARLGPLLQGVLTRMDAARPEARLTERLAVAAHVGGSASGDRLPLVLQLEPDRPVRGETWPEFKARVSSKLEPMLDLFSRRGAKPLYSAASIAGSFPPAEAAGLLNNDQVSMVELDPLVNPTLMDDAILDVGVAGFISPGGQVFTGAGVRVAVLDSGIDTKHPHLLVTRSISTCGESIDLPGRHGTHCAGSIASRDAVFPGVAPGVSLLNVKVLRANGSGRHTDITKGVDAALDLNAEVLSMSLGFNHLPAWSDRGHGWSCPNGQCPLCLAVDNAVSLGVVAVVAAGNEHNRAEALRAAGFGSSFDTEMACPGQARKAITVGAMTKRTFLPASFSSLGPTAYKSDKPDLAGPGVNIMSTIPAPRTSQGIPQANPNPALLFDRESGTSMATPIVAGAVALLIEQRRAQGLSVSPSAIRTALMSGAIAPVAQPANTVGAGRIKLS